MTKFENSWGIDMREGLAGKYLKPIRRKIPRRQHTTY
jgi:hypothetical protein